MSVWRYPFDPYLPGLPPAAHAAPVRALLDDLSLPGGAVRVLPRAYRPTRRAVLQVSSERPPATAGAAAGGADAGAPRLPKDQRSPKDQRMLTDQCYLKVLRPAALDRIRQAHEALNGVVAVPTVLAAAEAQGVLVLTALPGTTLRDRLLGGGPMPDPADVCGIQQRMAQADVGAALGAARRPDIARHAEVLAGLLPDDVALISHVAAVAEAAGGPVDGMVHGDLYEAQVIVGPDGGLALLDLDGAGAGALIDDCATMLAHLHVLAQWRPAAATSVHPWARGYESACGALVDPAMLRRRAAGMLLGLAAGGFSVQEPQWQDTARQRLALAVELAGGQPAAISRPRQ